jgi:hypothetical protein
MDRLKKSVAHIVTLASELVKKSYSKCRQSPMGTALQIAHVTFDRINPESCRDGILGKHLYVAYTLRPYLKCRPYGTLKASCGFDILSEIPSPWDSNCCEDHIVAQPLQPVVALALAGACNAIYKTN